MAWAVRDGGISESYSWDWVLTRSPKDTPLLREGTPLAQDYIGYMWGSWNMSVRFPVSKTTPN